MILKLFFYISVSYSSPSPADNSTDPEKNIIPKVVNPDILSPPNIDLNPPKSYNIFATIPYKRLEGKTVTNVYACLLGQWVNLCDDENCKMGPNVISYNMV